MCSELSQPCVPQVVITCQEAPSTARRLRKDLHKKDIGGDPVAARLPHAILTKMVPFSGWKRFEMNETLKFQGGDGNDLRLGTGTTCYAAFVLWSVCFPHALMVC